MDTVRIGLIGYGGMGRSHAGYLSKDEVPGARLAAVCDAFPSAIEAARAAHGDDVKYFDDPKALMK